MEWLFWQEVIFKFVGGLGLFLFGIKSMSDGLQKAAGDKMRNLIEKYTTHPIKGLLVGIAVTILLQTSTGTTVIAVGLVNAGLMTLRQAIAIIMGANIGTTLTAFIIGIRIEEYALPVLALGAVFLFFFKKRHYHYIGQALFGFGALFLGLSTMGGGVKPLKDLQIFADLIINLSEYKVLGVIVGTVFTFIVQSSSATIGILQTIADEGMIDLNTSLPILFGDNIGTTITAVLASIGASVAAKRAAAAHVIFNIVGTIIFMLAFQVVYEVVFWAGTLTGANIRMQIAYAHGLFNTANAIIQFPFIATLAYIVTKIIPGEDKTIKFTPLYLEPRLLKNPSIGLGQAQHEIVRMANLARDNLVDTSAYFLSHDEKKRSLAIQREELINHLDRKTTEYIVQLQQNPLNEQESAKSTVLLQTINDIERIGDHAENIMELGDFSIEKKVSLSEEAWTDLQNMTQTADDIVQLAIAALKDHDLQKAEQILVEEQRLDQMEREYRKRHIQRLNQNLCTGNAGAVYLDVLSNLERVGDHAKNIAQYVLYGE